MNYIIDCQSLHREQNTAYPRRRFLVRNRFWRACGCGERWFQDTWHRRRLAACIFRWTKYHHV